MQHLVCAKVKRRHNIIIVIVIVIVIVTAASMAVVARDFIFPPSLLPPLVKARRATLVESARTRSNPTSCASITSVFVHRSGGGLQCIVTWLLLTCSACHVRRRRERVC